RQVDPIAVGAAGLHLANLEGRRTHGERLIFILGSIERIDLASQGSTRERAHGLARVGAVEAARQHAVRQLECLGVAGPILLRKALRELLAAEKRTGVKPALGVDRRLVKVLL